MTAHDYLKETYHFSDFQIAQIRYTVTSLLSEFSKIIIMGVFFYYIDHLGEYLLAALVLCMLRTCTGGLHFKHYLSCFLVSFLIMFMGVYLLPQIYLNRILQLILLLVCILCNYYCSPIVSSYRPIPDGVAVRKSKLQSFTIIFIFTIVMYIIPMNPYLYAGFWIIILQSLQLIVAKILKRRKNHETSNKILDIQSM